MLAFAAVAIAIGIVLTVDRPTSLGPVLPAQNQDAETRLYLLGYFVILPLAIFAGTRLADRIAAGPNRGGLGLLSGILAVALGGLILGVRVSTRLPWGDGVGVLLGAALIWSAIAAALLARAARPTPWPALLRHSGAAEAGGSSPLSSPSGSFSRSPRWTRSTRSRWRSARRRCSMVVWLSERVTLPRPKRRWGIAADLAVIAVVVLAVIDLVVFRSAPTSAARSRTGSSTSTRTSSWVPPPRCWEATRCWSTPPPSTGSAASTSSRAGSDRPDRIRHLRLPHGVDRRVPVRGRLRDPADGGRPAWLWPVRWRRGDHPDLQPELRDRRHPAVGADPVRDADGADPRRGGRARRPKLAPAAWGASLAIVALASIWALEALAYTLAVLAAVAASGCAFLATRRRRNGWSAAGCPGPRRLRRRRTCSSLSRPSPSPGTCPTGGSTSPTCGAS